MNYYIKHSLMVGCCMLSLSAMAQQKNEWIHVYTTDSKVTSIQADEIDGIYFGSQGNHNLQIVTDNNNTTTFDYSKISKSKFAKNVPLLTITTDTYVSELPDKTTYYTATFKLEGYGEYEDVDTIVSIKGRGNSTWNKYPKKPYRLKFEKKKSLCGLHKAKNYVLLANYIDPTEIQNALAMKVAHLLENPYSNDMIPVNVVLNGVYRGSYMLSQKIGFNAGSIDDYDETQSILWELDTNYDEDYKFRSSSFRLPVMVKDPDMADYGGTTYMNEWKADFNEMETKVYNSTSFADKIDMQSVVNYMIINNICGNFELNWPKSVYMYKTKAKDDIYHLGPVWDFDWCFGYSEGALARSKATTKITDTSSYESGKPFFTKLCKEQTFMALYKKTWEDFYENKLPELWEFFDEYAELVEPAVYRNNEKYSQKESRDAAIERLRTWLQDRIEYINKPSNNYGLY